MSRRHRGRTLLYSRLSSLNRELQINKELTLIARGLPFPCPMLPWSAG